MDKIDYSFQREWSNFIDLSTTRWKTLFDIIEECAVYFILSAIFGILVEKIFFPEELSADHRITRPTWQLILLIFLQLTLDVIVIYYLVMIARLIPLAFGRNISISQEYISARAIIVISIVFIGLQSSMLARLAELTRRF